jgi:DNA modification methylase
VGESGMDPLTIIHGDALSSLRRLPDESVQCVVTSPPYWSLRDYGIPPIVWDGDPDCDHLMRDEAPRAGEAYGGKTKWQHVAADAQAAGVPVREQAPGAWEDLTVYRDSPIRDGGEGVGFNDAATTKAQRWKTSAVCSRCGAWRGCLGLEPTPELYVQHIVQIFRELKRVLKKDGTLWLNLGDSYSGSGRGLNGDGSHSAKPGEKQYTNKGALDSGGVGAKADMHDKRVEAGVIGRYWVAPPPGLKAKDLCGIPWMVAFALRADGWYLRSDIIWSKPNPMPESVTDRPTRSHEYLFLLTKSKTYYYDVEAIKEECVPGTLARVSQETLNTQTGGFKQEQYEQNFPGRKHRDRRPADILKHMGATGVGVTTRNRRSVWSIPTAPFSEAHFATFPKDLVIPCVLAGSKAGDVVMDPFGGSGTVGKVAIELGRKAILIEPNPEYLKMIEKRCQTTIGLPL